MVRQIIKSVWIIVLFSMLMLHLPPAQPVEAQAEATAAQYVTIARTAGSPQGFTSLGLYYNSLGENGTVAFQADRGAGNELWLWHNNNLSRIFEGIVTPDNFPNNLFVGHDGRVAITIPGAVNEEVHVRLPDGTIVRSPLNTDSSYAHNLEIHTSGGKWLVNQRSHSTVKNNHYYVYDNFWLTDGVGTSAPFQLEIYDVNNNSQYVSEFIFRFVQGITDDGAFVIHELNYINQQIVGERLYFSGTRNEVLFEFSRPFSGEDTGEFLGRVLLNGVGDVLFEKIPRVNGVPVKWSLMLSQNGGAPAEMAAVDPRTGQRFDRLLGLSAAREVLMLVQYGSSDYRWMDSFDLSADPVSVPFESLFGQPGTVQYIVNMNDSGQKALVGKLADNTLVLLVEQTTRWTILHYMAGDNDLDSTYADIFQHLESKANLPGVRILVFYDNRDALGSRYFEILYDTNPNQYAAYSEGATVWSQGELNTGAPKTLADFVKWGVAYAPAEHYALILDDHGSGLGGLAVDETDGNDWLTLVELRQALSSAYATTGRKMDVLYIAACLMGMIEDAYQVRGYADYYVASQQLQTAYTNYLSSFNPADAPLEVAVSFAVDYANEIAAKPMVATSEYTISVADLSKLEALATATNQFGQAMAERSAFILDELEIVKSQVQRYDNKAPKGALTQSDTYVDLHNFAFWTALALPGEVNIVNKANAVMAAVEDYILFERNGSLPPNTIPTQPTGVDVSNSHGVSIFFPGAPSSFYKAANYDFAAGATWGESLLVPAKEHTSIQETPASWAGFLSTYIALSQPGAADDPAPEAPIAKIQLEPTTFSIFLPLTSK